MSLEFPPVSGAPDDGEPFVSGELQTTDDQKNAVIHLLAKGLTRAAACKQLGIPAQHAHDWMRRDPTFAERANVARDWGCEMLEHEIQTAGHDYPPAQARVISENYKWLLSKRKPETYSDRMQLDVHSTVDVAGALSSARERVAQRLSGDPTRLAIAQAVDLPGVIEHGDTDRESEDDALARILE